MTLREWEEEQKPVHVWPEHAQAFDLWQVIGDQWLCNSGGPYALNHTPLHHELDRMELEKPEYDRLYSEIRVMASGALEAMATK